MKNYKEEASPLYINESSLGNNTIERYLCMDGYDKLAIQIEELTAPTDGTIQFNVYASLQDDGTNPDSCLYQDVTTAWFGGAIFTVGYYDASDICAKYVKIKIETTKDSAEDGSVKLYTRQKS